MIADPEITLGLEVLQRRGHPWLDQARIGLLANPASVNRDLVHAWQVIDSEASGRITALFTPQHGFWGDAQANMIETEHGWHRSLDVPVYSLYSETRRPTEQMLEKIDCLVVDLQDVGTRIYTFAWTVKFASSSLVAWRSFTMDTHVLLSISICGLNQLRKMARKS